MTHAKERPTSLADAIRQTLAASAQPLTCAQIFERNDGFENASEVSKQMFAFHQRGEVIRTENAQGKHLYALNPAFVNQRPRNQGGQGTAAAVQDKPHAAKPQKAKPAKAKPAATIVTPPPAPKIDRRTLSDPIDDDADEDNAVFAIDDKGTLAITNGDGEPTTLEPFQIARLFTFIDTTAPLWSTPE